MARKQGGKKEIHSILKMRTRRGGLTRRRPIRRLIISRVNGLERLDFSYGDSVRSEGVLKNHSDIHIARVVFFISSKEFGSVNEMLLIVTGTR